MYRVSLRILNWIWSGKETDMVPDIEQQPSVSELSKALGELKSGKAGGSSNILPEMVKVVGSDREFLELLLDLIYTVWEERQVPPDAIIIPIPKKGNLSDCNNWRGIALLEVIGKVVAKLLQQRSQVIAERESFRNLSACGFRKGRGCVDMIFHYTPTGRESIITESQAILRIC